MTERSICKKMLAITSTGQNEIIYKMYKTEQRRMKDTPKYDMT